MKMTPKDIALLLGRSAFLDIEICPPWPLRFSPQGPFPPRGTGWPWPCPPPPWGPALSGLLAPSGPDSELRAAAQVGVALVEHLRGAEEGFAQLKEADRKSSVISLTKSGISISEMCGTLSRAEIMDAIRRLLKCKPLPPHDPDYPTYVKAKLSVKEVMIFDAIVIAGAEAIETHAVEQVAAHSLARFSKNFA